MPVSEPIPSDVFPPDPDAPSGEVLQAGDAFADSTAEAFRSAVRQTPEQEERIKSRSRAFPEIPGYEIVDKLGRGSMGVVWLANDTAARRPVAIKQITSPDATGAELARFATEFQAMGRMRHPNIARYYTNGEVDGRPFFVLEYCKGGTLAEYLNRQPQPASRAAEIAETVAAAVQHAHEAEVVHRDLKPGNILLASRVRRTADSSAAKGSSPAADAARPEDAPYEFRADMLRITDFGLARQMDSDTENTKTQAAMGTPSYMAPEQAVSARKAGPAADVWSIGVILYEAIAGSLPFVGADTMEVLEALRTKDPIAPSKKVRVPRDLETICLKCLRKDPRDRYPTARALAEDLRAFREGRGIAARPMSRFRKTRRWALHNPSLALALMSIGLLVASALVWFAAMNSRLADSNADLEFNRYQSHLARAENEIVDNLDIDYARRLLGEVDPDLCGWEHRHLMHRIDHEPLVLRAAPSAKPETRVGVFHAAVSPDGSRVAAAGNDGTVRIYDLPSQTPTAQFRFDGVLSLPVIMVVWSPDGKSLAAAGFRGQEGAVGIWDAAGFAPGSAAGSSPKPLRLLEGHKGIVKGLTWMPDSKRLVSGSWDRTVRVWDAGSGECVAELTGHSGWVNGVAVDPSGRWVASASTDRTVRIWDLHTQKMVRVLRGHRGAVGRVAFSPDGSRIASASYDDTLGVWDRETGTRTLELRGHLGTTLGVAWSPDGSRIASCGFDRTVRIWDSSAGVNLLTLRGHEEMVWSVDFSADGRKLVSAGFDNTVRVWDSEPAKGPSVPRTVAKAAEAKAPRVGGRDLTNYVAFDAAGSRYAVSGRDGRVVVHDAKTDAMVLNIPAHDGASWGISFSPDGRSIASAGWDGFARVWDLEGGRMSAEFDTGVGVHAVAFHPETSHRLLLGTVDGMVIEWDAVERREVRRFERTASRFTYSVAWSPDGSLVAAGGFTTGIWVWDAATGKQVASLGSDLPSLASFARKPKPDTVHGATVYQVAFGKVGGEVRLASACWDRKVRVWKVPAAGGKWDADPLWVGSGHTDYVTTVGFDGTRDQLVSGSLDKTVRRWDLATGKPVGAPVRHHGWIWHVATQPGTARSLVSSWYRPAGTTWLPEAGGR